MHNPSPKPGRKKKKKKKKKRIVSVFSYQSERSSCCYALCVCVESRVQGGHSDNNNAKGERGTTPSAREETTKKRRREKRLEKMRIRIPGGRKLRGHKSVRVGVNYEA
jgi:hypothetical protein